MIRLINQLSKHVQPKELNLSFRLTGEMKESFISQVAMIRIALNNLGGIYTKAKLQFFVSGEKIVPLPIKWEQYFEKIEIHWATPEEFKIKGIMAPGRAKMTFRDEWADFVFFCDADVLIFKPFPEIISLLANEVDLVGVIAHYPPPRHDNVSPLQFWDNISLNTLGRKIDKPYKYTLATNKDFPDKELSCPFYPNFGLIAIRNDILRKFSKTFLKIKSKIEPSLFNNYFSGQVALPLAIEKIQLKHKAIDIIYNYPNDPIADSLYEEKIYDTRVIHYLRTEYFDRHKIFTNEKLFNSFLSLDLSGSNKLFQGYVRELTSGELISL